MLAVADGPNFNDRRGDIQVKTNGWKTTSSHMKRRLLPLSRALLGGPKRNNKFIVHHLLHAPLPACYFNKTCRPKIRPVSTDRVSWRNSLAVDGVRRTFLVVVAIELMKWFDRKNRVITRIHLASRRRGLWAHERSHPSAVVLNKKIKEDDKDTKEIESLAR